MASLLTSSFTVGGAGADTVWIGGCGDRLVTHSWGWLGSTALFLQATLASCQLGFVVQLLITAVDSNVQRHASRGTLLLKLL
jgi:hypothetical protein